MWNPLKRFESWLWERRLKKLIRIWKDCIKELDEQLAREEYKAGTAARVRVNERIDRGEL